MNPVFPNETRRERALRAARLHVHHATELTAESVLEVCKELLAWESSGALPVEGPSIESAITEHLEPESCS